jgi:hypothetical protein
MQDKIDTKEDKGQLNDEIGKLGGDKTQVVPKWDESKKKDESHTSKP